MIIPNFTNKEDAFAFLRTNKAQLVAVKKNTIKHADGIYSVGSAEYDGIMQVGKSYVVNKDDNPEALDVPKSLDLRLAINATNIYDSHGDVHIPGIWSKSIKEKKIRFLLQEHEMEFKKIIADSVNDGLIASVVQMSFKELGFKYEGTSDILIYSCNAKSDRNGYMVGEYSKGRVLNHSVGMRYIKYFLCMNSNSEFDVDEKKNWDKYYPMIANKTDVDPIGWFWAVTEAIEIEGSAVPLGSCKVTPVISVNEPDSSTQESNKNEPQKNALKDLLGI